MADARPFRMRRAWPVWTLLAISVLYFAFVLVLVGRNLEVSGVSTGTLALVGLALFVVTALVAIPFFLRRPDARLPPPAPEPEPLGDMQDEPTEAPRMAPVWDDELKRTAEQQQGMTVLEYSRPAKSQHRGGVYTKAYVPVTKEFVLRVETLVADGRDL